MTVFEILASKTTVTFSSTSATEFLHDVISNDGRTVALPLVARRSLGVGLARPHFAGVSSAAIFLLAETTASRSTCSRVTFFVAYMYPTITAETTE